MSDWREFSKPSFSCSLGWHIWTNHPSGHAVGLPSYGGDGAPSRIDRTYGIRLYLYKYVYNITMCSSNMPYIPLPFHRKGEGTRSESIALSAYLSLSEKNSVRSFSGSDFGAKEWNGYGV